MLDGLTPYLPLPPQMERPYRQQIFTTYAFLRPICSVFALTLTFWSYRQPESSIAPYLTDLQKRHKDDGVRVGSYPLLSRGVYVSLIGRNIEAVKAIAAEVAGALEGRLVTDEEAREMVREKERGAA